MGALQTTPTQRIIRLPEVINRTGKKRSTIYDALNEKSPRYDPTFPCPVRIGARSIGFYESEVQVWIESRREIGA
jgi:prophage regulatory protein